MKTYSAMDADLIKYLGRMPNSDELRICNHVRKWCVDQNTPDDTQTGANDTLFGCAEENYERNLEAYNRHLLGAVKEREASSAKLVEALERIAIIELYRDTPAEVFDIARGC